MVESKNAHFTIYPAEALIPRYQRAWVWGLAALVILLCGVAAGWLFRRAAFPPVEAGRPVPARLVDGAALLDRQKAVNARLSERIAGLEQVLAGDACAPAAHEALTQDAGGR